MTVAVPPLAPAGAAPGPTIRITPGPSRESDPVVPHESATALRLEGVSCWYGGFRAINDVSLDVERRRITALIGPSGCGKSTLLRTMNRLNELVPSFRLEGRITFDGVDIYGRNVDPVVVRRRVGMVFQKPNPFPKSVYDNVAFGPRINGYQGNLDEVVERSLRRAALWD